MIACCWFFNMPQANVREGTGALRELAGGGRGRRIREGERERGMFCWNLPGFSLNIHY